MVVDCTVGWGGHAAPLAERIGPSGKLIGIDLDAENLSRARPRLEATGVPFALHHTNFAGLATVLAAEGVMAADGIVADLGMSSMQVDDPARGLSYSRDGPLDMRMDRSRGRTAEELVESLPADELRRTLEELGDEPHARAITEAIVAARGQGRLRTTRQLAQLVLDATAGERERAWRLHPKPGRWETHPAARTFQVLRMLVNREPANLEELLRVLPQCLNPGGTAALISFHSGEDRRVKLAFRDGQRAGHYQAISPDPIRPTFAERQANPRSRSAKLRWARR